MVKNAVIWLRGEMKIFTKQIWKQFSILVVALAISSGIVTACASAVVDKQEGEAQVQGSSGTITETVQNKSVDNKLVEDKVATETEQLVTIFDGRVNERQTTEATNAEKQLVEKEFKRNETVIKQKINTDCDEDTPEGVSIVEIAEGSFTHPNAAQKIFLYERCRSGRAFGIGGIVVVENETVSAHYIYGENGLESGILSLPDINKNGLSEIILIGGGTNQGYTNGAIDLFEFKQGNLNFLGRTETYSDNSGAAENESKVETTAYKILARLSANPVFFRETYQTKGKIKKWSLAKKAQKLLLTKTDPMTFHKIS